MLNQLDAFIANLSDALSALPISIDTDFWTDLRYNNPFLLMFDLLMRGMFIPFIFLFWKAFKDLWLISRQTLFSGINPYVLLELHLPNMEVSPSNIEQLFNHIHGTLRSPIWWEIWWKGHYNLRLSFEIRAKDGNISYYISCAHKHKHVVQEALHLHYPGAWLKEVPQNEDYVKMCPLRSFPDAQYQMLGTEYHLANSYAYPLKTYRHYIDPQTGRFNDPLAVLLEMLSTLKPGEEIWYHVLIVPEFDTWQKVVLAEIETLFKKTPTEVKRSLFEEPFALIREILSQLIGGEPRTQFGHALRLGTEVPRQIFGLAEPAPYTSPSPAPSSSAEAHVEVGVEPPIDIAKEMENKVRTPGFKAKIRMMYFAKNEVFSKFRFWSEIHGSFRNFNHYKLNYLTRGLRATTHADYAFAKARKIYRQNRLLNNAKARDWYAGDKVMLLNSEELASLWHPPSPNLIGINMRYMAKTKTVPLAGELRTLEGYEPDKLLPEGKGAVPKNLPVADFYPLNYK